MTYLAPIPRAVPAPMPALMTARERFEATADCEAPLIEVVEHSCLEAQIDATLSRAPIRPQPRRLADINWTPLVVAAATVLMAGSYFAARMLP